MFSDDDLVGTRKKIVFYGAGRYAQQFAKKYCIDDPRVRLPDYVCDRDPEKWSGSFFGRPIVSPDRLFAEHPAGVVVIVATNPYAVLADARDRLYYYSFMPAMALEMKFCLAAYGDKAIDDVKRSFADEKSRTVFSAMTRDQADGQIWFRRIYEFPPYFGNDVVPQVPDGQVLVDAGAYTGDHIAAFVESNAKYARVYAFEPYMVHFDILRARFAHEPRVLPICSALHDENARVAFDASIPVGARVVSSYVNECEQSAQGVRLDDVAPDATFIKMDIEGSEVAAIRGAERTIRLHKPALAICVYHRPSDYLEIPTAILRIRSDYRLYLRQHSPFNIDTVLYAL